MTSDFEALVEALWAELGLGAPRRAGAPTRLTVDGQAVALSLSPDERSIVVSADIGPLAVDSVQLDQQLRRLLRDGAGLTLRHAAAVRVMQDPDGVRRAVVEAACACRRGGTAALSQAIEDVLAAANAHRSALSAPPRPATAPAHLPDDHLIFRL